MEDYVWRKNVLLFTVEDKFSTPPLTTSFSYNFTVVYISSEYNRSLLKFWLEIVTAMNIITKVSAEVYRENNLYAHVIFSFYRNKVCEKYLTSVKEFQIHFNAKPTFWSKLLQRY